jgi:hypothetical protein
VQPTPLKARKQGSLTGDDSAWQQDNVSLKMKKGGRDILVSLWTDDRQECLPHLASPGAGDKNGGVHGTGGLEIDMAKAVQRPDHIEIASLKTKQVQESNVMQAGGGTAWEDRGALGLIKAFFVTCIKSMTSPGEQWDQIRRLENTRDATTFAIGCGIVAGISWVVQSLWFAGPFGFAPMPVKDDSSYEVDWQKWAIGSALQLACAIVGMILLLRLANLIYQKLLPHAVAAKIPSALTYNIFAYALGPVLLVFIPMVGWLIALVWVTGLFILAGTRRLRLGMGTAIINGILTVIITAGVGAAAYGAGHFAWDNLYGSAVTPPHPPGYIPS